MESMLLRRPFQRSSKEEDRRSSPMGENLGHLEPIKSTKACQQLLCFLIPPLFPSSSLSLPFHLFFFTWLCVQESFLPHAICGSKRSGYRQAGEVYVNTELFPSWASFWISFQCFLWLKKLFLIQCTCHLTAHQNVLKLKKNIYINIYVISC